LKKPGADVLKFSASLKILNMLISAAFISGCSSSVFYDIPYEFRFPEEKTRFIKKYSVYLQGKEIFLDPGHGGNDRSNTGYEGNAVEADINLSVALFLRDYLREAGAHVFMSRENDITVELKSRSLMANLSGADISLSIHHNAPGKEGDYWTNYTSTYYHAREDYYSFEPCEKDLAKYIQRDLAYAMRNSGGLGSFDGTYSDYMIYPGDGFSVLRLTGIPSILIECGFTTHHHESERLSIPEFNRVQAWGIFRGLCRYFAAGIPEINSFSSDTIFVNDTTAIFSIRDSSGIDASSIIVQVDSVSHDFNFDEVSGILKIDLRHIGPGDHIIRIIAVNKKGNHSFPYHRKFFIKEI
jgi:N-acetylmuramoyl-L-alanine amidase